jgi:hypothetical protein
MKAFVILSVLVAGAFAARLDNTYIPPASAHSAGGHNLDTPKLALASNVQNAYAAPSNQFQAQSFRQPGLNQGTFTSVSSGKGFQSVSVGAQSSNVNRGAGFQQQQYQAPAQQQYQAQAQQQSYQAPAQQQQSYQAPQQTYQAQPQYNNYQANQNQASTTPIPILECKKSFLWNIKIIFYDFECNTKSMWQKEMKIIAIRSDNWIK